MELKPRCCSSIPFFVCSFFSFLLFSMFFKRRTPPLCASQFCIQPKAAATSRMCASFILAKHDRPDQSQKKRNHKELPCMFVTYLSVIDLSLSPFEFVLLLAVSSFLSWFMHALLLLPRPPQTSYPSIHPSSVTSLNFLVFWSLPP